MLTADGCRTRRKGLQEQFEDYDLLLISQPRHVFYLSGFLTAPTELAGWGINFLLVDRDGHSRLVVDNWAEESATAAHVDDVDIWTWYDFFAPAAEKLEAGVQAIEETLDRHYSGAARVAIESAHLPGVVRDALGATQINDLGPALHRMRRSKYEDELACIRRAIRATEAGHRAARESIRPGLTELDLYAEVQSAITRIAGEPIVMLGDFAAGTRSEAGGGPPTENVLTEGDLMIFDLFPVVGGYRADITNTLCAGEPTQEQRDHIDVLRDAMVAGENALRPGVNAGDVYAACLEPIAAADLDAAFFHHAGHGLGLGHPEPPYLVADNPVVLQVGDVVTLEPGAYVEGWGGARIEHNYLIIEEGYERLSNHEISL